MVGSGRSTPVMLQRLKVRRFADICLAQKQQSNDILLFQLVQIRRKHANTPLIDSISSAEIKQKSLDRTFLKEFHMAVFVGVQYGQK